MTFSVLTLPFTRALRGQAVEASLTPRSTTSAAAEAREGAVCVYHPSRGDRATAVTPEIE